MNAAPGQLFLTCALHFAQNRNFDRLLSDLSDYIGTRIDNKATSSEEERIQWSRRWYDLDSTKPEDRFVIDPEIVLQQITDQTGITFRAEKRTVKSLVID